MPLKGYWRRGKGIRFCFGQPHRRQQAQLGCASEPGASTIDTCMFDPRQVSELDHLCSVWITRMCTNLRFRLWAFGSSYRFGLKFAFGLLVLLLLGFLHFCSGLLALLRLAGLLALLLLGFLHYCFWASYFCFRFGVTLDVCVPRRIALVSSLVYFWLRGCTSAPRRIDTDLLWFWGGPPGACLFFLLTTIYGYCWWP